MAGADTPIVSVVMPAYQHEKFVEEAIDSILSQTLSRIELIVVDDASVDSTVAKVEKFKHDPRLILVKRVDNGGPSIATNDGLARASGRYVALIGGDDVAEPWRLAHQVGIAEKRAADAVFSEPEIIDERGRFLQRSVAPVFFPIPKLKGAAEVLRYLIVKENFLCAPTALLRREAMLRVGGFNPDLWQLQDYDYWLRMAAARMNFCFMERPVTRYRQHANNLSSKSRYHRVLGELTICIHGILSSAPGDILAEAFPEMIAPGKTSALSIDRAMIAVSLGRSLEIGAALLISSFLNEGVQLACPGLSHERLGELTEGNCLRSDGRLPFRITDPGPIRSTDWDDLNYQGNILA